MFSLPSILFVPFLQNVLLLLPFNKPHMTLSYVNPVDEGFISNILLGHSGISLELVPQ